jgi:hypothetical protein
VSSRLPSIFGADLLKPSGDFVIEGMQQEIMVDKNMLNAYF